ncbi:hypothetical protein PV797_17340 [Clostridiaceae bacterium M8S5]|nr:hypothetical protein PV797_17340 [Clostridiaceae bacterium M8S5]
MFKFGSKEIDIDYSIMSKNNIPILIEDKRWLKIFGDIKDRELEKLKRDLMVVIADLNKAKKDKNKATKDKRKLMAEIINLSHRVNNGDEKNSLAKLQVKKEELLKINDIIEEAQFNTEILPSKIKKANFNLLKTTIKKAYENLKEDEECFDGIVGQIDEYRKLLKDLIDKKNDYEEKINETYKFMHSILGSSEIDKLDKNMY